MSNDQVQEIMVAHYRAISSKFVQEMAAERMIVLPSQMSVDHGSTWIQLLDDKCSCVWGHERSHIHWGKVLTTREYALGRLNAGDTPEEMEENISTMTMRHARGWRLSTVNCDVRGEGGLESLALASLWPCAEKEYAMASWAGFLEHRMRSKKWFQETLRRWSENSHREVKAAGLYGSDDPVFVPLDERDGNDG